MNNIKKFCEKYDQEIIAVGVGIGLGLAIIVFGQAKKISTFKSINAHNHKLYLKLLGENEFLGRIINKIV